MIDVTREARSRFAPAALWSVIADTNMLNRAAGLGTVQLTPTRGASAARFLGRASIGGMTATYEELPFEWEYPRRVVSTRRMLDGPIKLLRTTFALEPDGEGSVVRTRLEIEPRWRILSFLLAFQAPSAAQKLADTVCRLGEGDAERRAGAVDEVVVRRAAELLVGDPAAPHAERLLSVVRDGDDLIVARVRPYVLADEWGVSRTEVLATCLSAVTAGLLDLKWEVVCPGCVNPTERLPSLSEIGAEGRCHVCDVAFVVDFDGAVEATFTPSPAARRVEVGPWCSGGPARSPHTLTQALLAAGGTARMPAPDREGHYRLFIRGGTTWPIECVPDAPAEAVAAGLGAVRVAPGGTVIVENPNDDKEIHARLERLPDRSQAATARDVTAMPTFRARFSSETLRPGISLRVARMSLLFTDLAASTAMYTTMGDAAAYRVVSDHFETLRAVIDRNRGAVVKTIGDAIMAAFSDEDDALRAGVESLAAVEAWRQERAERRVTHVKVGVYAGPCYAVQANGVLDYFGQTVNLAARLQGLAEAGELVVEAGVADRAAHTAPGTSLRVSDPFPATLKGIGAPVPVVRIRLASVTD